MTFSSLNLSKLKSLFSHSSGSLKIDNVAYPLFVKYPFYVQLSLNKTCNLKCIFCARQTDLIRNQLEKDDNLNMTLAFLKEHSSLFEFADYVNLAADGEPLNHPDIVETLKTLSGAAKKPNVIFITNGTLLNGDLSKLLVNLQIKEIHFSIDSLEKKTSRFIRPGVDLNRLIKNIENINFEKRKQKSDFPVLIMRPTFISENIDELPNMVDFCYRYGFKEIIVQQMQIYKMELAKYSLVHCKERVKKNIENAQQMGKLNGVNIVIDPVIKNINRQSFHDIKNAIEKVDNPIVPSQDMNVQNLKNKCDLPWRFMLIQTNGDVYPCCQSKYYLGNLNENSWKQVWNGKRAKELRRKFLNDILPKECVNQPCGIGKLE